MEIVYTDNVRGDKAELERVFPSLLCDVLPIPDSSTLPKLTIPTPWTITILATTFQINGRMNDILDEVQALQDHQLIYLAMDMEWSVDLVNGIHGRVALISIAYKQSIYLIPVRFVAYMLARDNSDLRPTGVKIYASRLSQSPAYHPGCTP